MKRVYGLVAIMALFVSCTTSPPPAPAPPPAAPAAKPHGTLLQLMRGIPFPNSNIIFDTQTNDPGAAKKPAAGGAGTPATQQYSGLYGGWEAVENAAIAIQETANLILIPGRLCGNGKPVPVDQADFQKWAQGLADAGAATLKAAQSKNIDQMVEASGTLSDACLACHEKYRETPKQPDDRCTP